MAGARIKICSLRVEIFNHFLPLGQHICALFLNTVGKEIYSLLPSFLSSSLPSLFFPPDGVTSISVSAAVTSSTPTVGENVLNWHEVLWLSALSTLCNFAGAPRARQLLSLSVGDAVKAKKD